MPLPFIHCVELFLFRSRGSLKSRQTVPSDKLVQHSFGQGQWSVCHPSSGSQGSQSPSEVFLYGQDSDGFESEVSHSSWKRWSLGLSPHNLLVDLASMAKARTQNLLQLCASISLVYVDLLRQS